MFLLLFVGNKTGLRKRAPKLFCKSCFIITLYIFDGVLDASFSG